MNGLCYAGRLLSYCIVTYPQSNDLTRHANEAADCCSATTFNPSMRSTNEYTGGLRAYKLHK